MTRVFIGIDPGGSGGLACIDEDGAVIDCVKMPATSHDIFDVIDLWANGGDASFSARAVKELVNGHTGQSASASFRFGQSDGRLEMALVAAKVPFSEVPPGTWQRVFGLPPLSKAGSKTKKKNAHKSVAQRLFPGVTMTHALADALLIAEWGRRQEIGA